MSADPKVAVVVKALLYDALRLQQGDQSGNRPTLEPGDKTPAPAAPVTAGADPQPGWYVALRNGRPVSCIERVSRGWLGFGEELTEEWPYMVFTLGPRVDDLLRDAARYRSREQEVVAARENLRDCGTALRMIRDAVEELGPVGAVPSRDIGPPNPVQDATDIITGIQALIDAEIAREEK